VLEEVLAVDAGGAARPERQSPPHVPPQATRRVDHEIDRRPPVALVKAGAEVEPEPARLAERTTTSLVRRR